MFVSAAFAHASAQDDGYRCVRRDCMNDVQKLALFCWLLEVICAAPVRNADVDVCSVWTIQGSGKLENYEQAVICYMILPFATSSPVRMIGEDPWRAMWNSPHTRMLFDANVCSVDRSQ